MSQASFLIDSGASVELSSSHGASPLMIAAQKGQLRIVQLLLRRGALIDSATSVSRATPLFAAASVGSLGVVRFLVDSGAKVDFATTNGATPLFAAASAGHHKIVHLLASSGADPNVAVNVQQQGRKKAAPTTPMFTACAKGFTDAVRTLLGFGADPARTWTAPDGSTWTPLRVSRQLRLRLSLS